MKTPKLIYFLSLLLLAVVEQQRRVIQFRQNEIGNSLNGLLVRQQFLCV
jgi:hypothetical protein